MIEEDRDRKKSDVTKEGATGEFLVTKDHAVKSTLRCGQWGGGGSGGGKAGFVYHHKKRKDRKGIY